MADEVEFFDGLGNKYEADPSKAVFRIGVYVIVRNLSGEFLVIKNRVSQWVFPGGGLEVGEELTETAIREVLEETGYTHP